MKWMYSIFLATASAALADVQGPKSADDVLLPMEQRITSTYLQTLCDAYADHFRHYDGAPVLAVDTEHFHPAANEADFASLLDRLAGLRARRALLDPRGEAALP